MVRNAEIHFSIIKNSKLENIIFIEKIITSYHIISYHIISYHIISYHIILYTIHIVCYIKQKQKQNQK